MRVSGVLKAISAVALCICCALFVLLLILSPVFAGGSGYELYTCATSSSQIIHTEHPFLEKLTLRVRGESARYEGDKSAELIEAFRARLLFCEEACGVKNYYLYSPFLGEGVAVNGYTVNLHIAVSGEQTAAGTPLIFGGF